MNFFKRLLGIKDEIEDGAEFIRGTIRTAPGLRSLPLIGTPSAGVKAKPRYPNYSRAPEPRRVPNIYEIAGDSRSNQQSFADVYETGLKNATPSYAQPFRGMPRINTRFEPIEYMPTDIEELRRRLMR